VEDVKAKLGMKAKNRHLTDKAAGSAYALKEATAPYNTNFAGKMFYPMKHCPRQSSNCWVSLGVILRDENKLLWKVFT